MSKLYLIPTPIGNLQDITIRALQLLKEVDVVLAEDTRITKKLFKEYNISTLLIPFHMHNEYKELKKWIIRLKKGERIAIVSDAGTPVISDPGALLVAECIRKGISVDCLPGATAFVPALVNSGISTRRFVFEGFLPLKKGRKKRLELLSIEERTVIIYESTHRIIKTLLQIVEYFGSERQISVSRELSKIFEETKRGRACDVLEYFKENKIKGEFVIVISGNNEN